MRRLGHHIYSSFSGQRTVWLSPWLEDLRGVLEARAQACYHYPDRYDIIHCGGWWLITFVCPNGQDHVGRPRQLVHQMLLSSQEAPAIFSPLFVREACLSRLSHDDPSIEQRLIHDLDLIDLSRVMPSPAEFGNVLRGRARPCLSALLRILLQPGAEQEVALGTDDGLRKEFSAALCVVLLHRPDCHISNLPQPLAAPPWCTQVPPLLRLKIPDASASSVRSLRVSSEHTMMAQPLSERGEWMLDVVSAAQYPPQVLLLLRRIPLQSLLDPPHCTALMGVLLTIIELLGRDGVPRLDPCLPQSLHTLQILDAAGARDLCTAIVTAWHEAHPQAGFAQARDANDSWDFSSGGSIQHICQRLQAAGGSP